MRSQRFDDRFIVRLERDEPAVETLTAFLADQDIGFASVSGAGAVREVRLAFWDAKSRRYEDTTITEQLEVVSFLGNASTRDGRPFLHLHGVFGRRDLSVLGGHIREAIVHPTLEVWLRAEDVDVHRERDHESGLDLLALPANQPVD
jgi:predicted DNA-binding protein with PD1-like motif